MGGEALSLLLGGAWVVTLLTLLVVPRAVQRLARRPRPEPAPGPAPRPAPSEPVTVIIPVHNEAGHLEEKLRNLFQSRFPRELMTVVAVDDGSTDGSVALLESLPVTLLHSPRGKANALNRGIAEARTDLIACTDADTLLSPNALADCLAAVRDRVGAACATVVVGEGSWFYSRHKAAYHRRDWELRTAEGALDSAVSLDGKLLVFRRDLFPSFSPSTLNDDYEIVFALRRKGARSVVVPGAFAYEAPPRGLGEEIKQIRRRVRGGIVANFRNLGLLFNPRFSWFGLVFFPFHRFLPFLLPFFALLTAIALPLLLGWPGALLVAGLAGGIALVDRYLPVQLLGVSLAWVDLLAGAARRDRGGRWDKINT